VNAALALLHYHVAVVADSGISALSVCIKPGIPTSVVVFTDVAVVVVAIPDVNAECLSLVVVERSETFVPSTPDGRLLRPIPAAALNTV